MYNVDLLSQKKSGRIRLYINKSVKWYLLLQTIELSGSLTSSPHCSTVVVIKPGEIATSRSGHANKLSMPVRLCPRYMGLFDVR